MDVGIHQFSDPLSVRGFNAGPGKQGAGSINLYPNPAHDTMTLISRDLPGKARQWRVVDCKGVETGLKDRFDGDSGDWTSIINISNAGMASGLYFLCISIDEGPETIHPFIHY